MSSHVLCCHFSTLLFLAMGFFVGALPPLHNSNSRPQPSQSSHTMLHVPSVLIGVRIPFRPKPQPENRLLELQRCQTSRVAAAEPCRCFSHPLAAGLCCEQATLNLQRLVQAQTVLP